MTSLPLPPSTRQSVSQGPWVIVTLTDSFVDQPLILIKKKKKSLGIAFELKRRMKPLQPRVIVGQVESNEDMTLGKPSLQNPAPHL